MSPSPTKVAVKNTKWAISKAIVPRTSGELAATATANVLHRRSTRRDAVHLTVAGGGHHPAVVADRDTDRIPGRLRQRVVAQGAPSARIEDQQRPPPRSLAGSAGHHDVADALAGQTRRR